MKEKTRKLFSRVGAAFMLGMSLFNFGMGVSKGAEKLPKRSKHFRKKQKEEVETEVQQISDIAEEEAQAVLSIQQMKTNVQEQSQEQETRTAIQQAMRYSAVTVWGLSMTLIFTSAIFNYPFGLGKAMLALLPGHPHVAKITLAVEDGEFHYVGDDVKIIGRLDSKGESVDFAKVVINYNPEDLDFERYSLSDNFSGLESKSIDKEVGEIVLSLKNEAGPRAFGDEQIFELYFDGLKKSPREIVKISQYESFVMKREKISANILGKVVDAKFKLFAKADYEMFCNKLNYQGEQTSRKAWEPLTKGGLVSKESNWTKVSNEIAFICGYLDEGRVILLISSTNQNIGKVSFSYNNKKLEKKGLDGMENWQEGDQQFTVIPFDVAFKGDQITEMKNVKIEIETKSGGELRWPAEGLSEVVIK